jgi:hypothetical protein
MDPTLSEARARCMISETHMATENDLRRIALALPETHEDAGRLAFSVLNKGKSKGIAWSWMERIHPKKARVENRTVIAIPVASLDEKDMLIGANPGKYFTEPHYNGYKAILVRLADVDVDELRGLITNAWCCMAPKPLVEAFISKRNDGAAAAH